ncbi:hypothetical protein B0J17DRAFT_767711 [Rhizoctonia solani]|nr:hypothetical protein B0J17DRAFT_767711 [Rhizoctonia solani]
MWYGTFADCLSTHHERDQQRSGSRFSGVISTPPTFQPEMRTIPPPGPRPKQESFDNAERLRGGALACACCGGGGGSQPSLNPQPEAVPETSQATQTSSRVPVNETQQTSQPPPSQPVQKPPRTPTKPSDSSLPASTTQGEAARMRSVSLHPVTSSRTADQKRRQANSLPSKNTAQTAQTASTGSGVLSPVYEVPANRGNPAVPMSVSTISSTRGAPVKAPFVR